LSQTELPLAHSRVGSLAIEIQHLTKIYGTARATDDLSFQVCAGEVFALLGPNGAGKTTTVEILEGHRKPDAGMVHVLGLDPWKETNRLKPRIGVMPQEGGLYPTITPREALELFAHFYPHPAKPAELLQAVGLEGVAGTRYRRLSGGQKQRLSLALALIGEPELAFLDEPTAGLDPQARRSTWDIIRSLRDSGVTVLLTTHYLEEAEQLADRVAIINHGRLVALGTPAELMRGAATALRLQTASAVDPDALASAPSARSVRMLDGRTYLIETSDAPALLAELAMMLRDAGILITDVRVGEKSLEEVFLALTQLGYES
jgi:ABC-2 type transport system ATP-binding protein